MFYELNSLNSKKCCNINRTQGAVEALAAHIKQVPMKCKIVKL